MPSFTWPFPMRWPASAWPDEQRPAGPTTPTPRRSSGRFRLFHAETEPLIDFYRQRGLLTTVDAAQPINAVTAAILDALNVPYPHK